MNQADVWREFQGKFMELAREEAEIERAQPKDRMLRAVCDYKEHPEVSETGKPEQAAFCLLETPVTGIWNIYGGTENIENRFRALAVRAAVALGSPKDTDAEDFWYHQLYLDLLANKSDHLLAASREGGIIERVCLASSTFCSRLEMRAINHENQSQTKPTSQLPPQPEQPQKTQKTTEDDHALGEWAERMLRTIREFSELLRASKKPDTLSQQFPELFTDVFEVLRQTTRDSFFERATRQRINAYDLMEVLAEAKGLKGPTLNDHRKAYRRTAGLSKRRSKKHSIPRSTHTKTPHTSLQ